MLFLEFNKSILDLYFRICSEEPTFYDEKNIHVKFANNGLASSDNRLKIGTYKLNLVIYVQNSIGSNLKPTKNLFKHVIACKRKEVMLFRNRLSVVF